MRRCKPDLVAVFYRVDWEAEKVSSQRKKPRWERKASESSLVPYAPILILPQAKPQLCLRLQEIFIP